MKLSILVNNYVTSSKLLAEHGLSFFIEAHDRQILFDTGQTAAFIHNAKVLELDLTSIETIILSHGHYDHTGGLESLLKLNNEAKLFMHPLVFQEKYSLKNGNLKYAGIPFDLNKAVVDKNRLNFNTKASYIYDNVLLSGEIPRNNDFEVIPKSLMIKEDGKLKQDNIIDEQMLIIREKRGIIIILGCSHPGVANCIEYASSLIPNEKILALVGGMHLNSASNERIDKTINYLKSKDIERIIPLHCTGFKAMCEIKRVFKDKCIIGTVGEVLEIL